MKRIYSILAVLLCIAGNITAQNLSSSEGGYESKRIINKKKFRVLYAEVAIDKTVDEVWQEVSGNFTNIGEIVQNVNFSRCLSGDITSGLGAERLCNLNYQGDVIELKERIIDFKECGDHREFTYDVYDSGGSPIKTYATWLVKKGKDGKTYLGSVFVVRANFGLLTGLVAKKLEKQGLKSGVLAYKHYLETGEKKASLEKLNALYPE